MSLKITHKNSTAAGTPPTAGDIDVGEIAINAADAELYTKDTAGNIKKFANTDTTSAADGVNFTQAGTGAVQRTVESKLQDVVSVKDFGAVGDASVPDTSAIQAAINYASSLASSGNSRGAIVDFPPGLYLLTGTLVINTSRVHLRGAGRYRTVLVRNANYGNTISVDGPSLLEQIQITGLSLFHDITFGTAMTGVHIVWEDVHQGRIQDVEIANGQYGIAIYGGVDTVLDQVSLIGRNSATAGHNGQCGLIIEKSATGVLPIPTQIRGHSVRIFGPRVAGWNIGLQINHGEDCSFESCYFGNQKLHNVLINQAGSDIILETSFGPGCYFDGSGSHDVILTGASGDGSVYIGNTKFIGCNFKGQGGDATNGLFIDGTVRAGAYPQAARGVIVDGCTFSALKENGIWAVGGNNISISNCQIAGNNYFNTTGGRGILIGAAVDGITVSNCRIGRNPESSAVNSLQTYGIEVVAGATNVTLVNNDVRYNTTGSILIPLTVTPKLATNNLGFNGARPATAPSMPASGVNLTNPYGSDAWVSIFGGTVSNIALNGQTVSAATPLQLRVAANDYLTIAYTVAPAWIWWPS